MRTVDNHGLIVRADSALKPRGAALYRVQSIRRSALQDTTVCLAEETETGVPVELTVLSGDLAKSDDLLAALREHVASMQTVSSHPGIAKLYECYQRDADAVVLAAEYPAGATLRDVLQREGRFGPSQAVCLAIQMAEALERVHSVGLVHGALRPENVVMSAQTVVLTQVGVEWLLSQRTSRSAPVTASLDGVAYRAPEQASGTATERSDVYAVGAILYEMVVGALPTGPASGGTNAPRAVRPEITPSLERIIVRALDPSPEARQQDASVLCNDLWDERKALLQQRSSEGAKPSGASRGAGQNQRARPRRLIALGAVAPVGVLLAWLVYPGLPVVSRPVGSSMPAALIAGELPPARPSAAPTIAGPCAPIDCPPAPASSASEVAAPQAGALSPRAPGLWETLAAGSRRPATRHRPAPGESASPQSAASQGKTVPTSLDLGRTATSPSPPTIAATEEDSGAIIDWLLSQRTHQRD
jgi:Protein kinase domain